ncbi:MAG: hypothetical protein R2762_19750 [Bryobacteraceae bacterium]
MTSRTTFFYLAAAAAAGLALGIATRPASAADAVRFDHVVRNDFFSGFSGNSEALDRAMAVCEKVLAADPNHAEALVWHGAGLYFRAGQHFMKGEPDKGMPLAGRGLAEMDKAVALAPDNIGVRIPRGSAVGAAARTMPDNPYRKELYGRVLDDHLHVYDMQKDRLDQLGVHPRGELLFAIADAYSRTGQPAKAEDFFTKLAAVNPGTLYARRAAKWLETRQPLPLNESQCIGCHTAK